jgi:uncharacterized protein (DUF427 family)
MPASTGPSPGQSGNPLQRISITPATGRWRATRGDTLLADSANAIQVAEQGYPAVLYFPPVDVRLEQLRPSATRTTCPYKGEARYFTLAVGKHQADVAWYYPQVVDGLEPLAGRIAFFANRLDVRVIAVVRR